MRLFTYVFAAAVLWAVAATGPATSIATARTAGAPRAEAPPTPPRAAASAYPR